MGQGSFCPYTPYRRYVPKQPERNGANFYHKTLALSCHAWACPAMPSLAAPGRAMPGLAMPSHAWPGLAKFYFFRGAMSHSHRFLFLCLDRMLTGV